MRLFMNLMINKIDKDLSSIISNIILESDINKCISYFSDES
jgi:hypothetical protein